ncbi:MAG: hypothetical protein PHS62_05170 [Patescibacteria group bacterium]|nr:hypothetical protein [Patescibacteria group bacterium]
MNPEQPKTGGAPHESHDEIWPPGCESQQFFRNDDHRDGAKVPSEQIRPGDIVEITDPNSAYHQQNARAVRAGEDGGWYFKYSDGQVAYRPGGFKKLKEQKIN